MNGVWTNAVQFKSHFFLNTFKNTQFLVGVFEENPDSYSG